MTAPPDLLYVKRSNCDDHLAPINMAAPAADTRDKVLRAGQTEVCPDCGRIWTVVQEIVWGGPVTVKWQAMRPASVPDPVNARLVALEAAVAAQAARITALEARTVTTHRALPAATAAIAVGGTQTLTITWKTPFPDSEYTVEALPVPVLLNKITPTVTTKTAAGCSITVASTVLVTVGTALLDVTATRYA